MEKHHVILFVYFFWFSWLRLDRGHLGGSFSATFLIRSSCSLVVCVITLPFTVLLGERRL
jgi:hypothetical protein